MTKKGFGSPLKVAGDASTILHYLGSGFGLISNYTASISYSSMIKRLVKRSVRGTHEKWRAYLTAEEASL